MHTAIVAQVPQELMQMEKGKILKNKSRSSISYKDTSISTIDHRKKIKKRKKAGNMSNDVSSSDDDEENDDGNVNNSD